MAQVSVKLPRLFHPIIGDVRQVSVESDTARGALESLFDVHPELRVHIFDEQSEIRPHVLCFVNETGSRLATDVSLTDGDEVTILQAVSGG